jgi:hypothetical protein
VYLRGNIEPNRVRAHMLRFITILLVIVLAAIKSVAAQTPDNAESNRLILIYIVIPPDQNAKNGVESWLQAFENNLRSLLSEFTSGNSSKGPIIKVRLSTENVNRVNSDMLQSSFSRQPTLQVLSTVGRFGGQSTFVDNDIYLGDLKGSLSDPFVYISREIQPESYKVTREALAAVTLYAYAMAIAKILPPESNRYQVCRVLDRANMYKDRDLGADTRDHLKNLFAAVSTELEARSCGGKK